MEADTLALAQEMDFSMLALFARATFTVKVVMILLIVMSFWSWAIIVQKFLNYRRARNESATFDQAFWSGEPLDELFETIGPEPQGASQRIFSSGMMEWRRSHRQDGGLIAGAQARIDRSMDVAIAKESEGLNKGLSFLATTGATAPFIGLFGTVWGIKHAFEQIAISQNTNLAVVAPGIAEALLATGMGLLAAIPAVVFYNKLSADSDRIVGGYEAFADEFSTILSRQRDAGAVAASVIKGGGGGRRRGRKRGGRAAAMSEINVTPFVDVMLVLLIIFMVAAPLLTVGVPVELPRTAAQSLPTEQEEPLTITITADGRLMIQTTETAEAELIPKLRAIAAERRDDKVFLRADGSIPYERVVQVMGALNAGGFRSIGLVTDTGGPRFDGSVASDG